MDLPNEIWFKLLMFLDYFNVLSLSQTSKRFNQLSFSRSDFKEHVNIVWSIFDGERETYFNAFKDSLKQISSNICCGFSNLFKPRQYLVNYLEVKMEKLVWDLQLFKIFCHIVHCKRRIRSDGKCKLCTTFFVDKKSEVILLKNCTDLTARNVTHNEVRALFETAKTSFVYPNIFYKTSDFIEHGPRCVNYSELFSDLIDKPFLLYVFYLEIFFRVFFNSLKSITDFIIFNYYSRERLEKKLAKEDHDGVRQSILNIYYLALKKLKFNLNCQIKPDCASNLFFLLLISERYNKDQINICDGT